MPLRMEIALPREAFLAVVAARAQKAAVGVENTRVDALNYLRDCTLHLIEVAEAPCCLQDLALRRFVFHNDLESAVNSIRLSLIREHVAVDGELQ